MHWLEHSWREAWRGAWRRTRQTVCLAGLLLTAAAGLAETATIHLTDGSKLRGEVLSLKGGQYTIKGAAFGTLQIDQQKIRLVEYGAAAGSAAEPATDTGHATADVQALQQRMMANPELIARIQALQNDSDIQAIIRDPAIQKAIAAGDYETLMRHPKLTALMNKPEIKAITRDVQGR